MATPYALALAAVMSVESPFTHSDTLKGAPDSGDSSVRTAEAVAAKRLRDRQQQHARAAHAQFRDPRGDALSALRVFCAYLAGGSDDSFCRCSFPVLLASMLLPLVRLMLLIITVRMLYLYLWGSDSVYIIDT